MAMDIVSHSAPVVAAAGHSLIYLLGGGLFGAFLIFVIAKTPGRQCVPSAPGWRFSWRDGKLLPHNTRTKKRYQPIRSKVDEQKRQD
jgi:hypothetical protein